MTKIVDRLTEETRAAQIVKATAEQTATSLNISYIQKDVAEIKLDIKSMTTAQDGKVEQLQTQISYLQKVVYMGLGGLTVLSFLLKFFIK